MTMMMFLVARPGCRRALAQMTPAAQRSPTFRSYCRTFPFWEGEKGGDEAAATKKKGDGGADDGSPDAAAEEEAAATRLLHKMAAQDYNNRRAAYRRKVTVLRKRYAEEVAEQRALDKAEEEERARQLTRQRLERQRKKNTRTAQNAIRQEALRLERAREFEEHLKVMEQRRGAKEERFAKARQLVVDELEKEAPMWLTTPEEVEAAFTQEAEQLLWARPGGVLGAPNPSLDCHFWQYETHTWHMDRTYKSQREVLLESLEEMAYDEANIDKSFWTEERLEEQQKLEDKARLRAMVHSAGRSELLRRQKLMLEEGLTANSSFDGDGDIPKPMPAPNLKMLKDDRALEREGARVLMADPTKFFVFDGASADETADGGGGEDEAAAAAAAAISSSSSYSGPTLGKPTGLRDPLREGSHLNQVFPQVIGRIPKPDTRTEREKKQQEREERLLAAAQAEAQADKDIDMAAQRQTIEDMQPDLNYDEIDWDEDEVEWKKGLDPVADADILNTPRELRYSEDDIEWVASRLEDQLKHLEQQFSQDVESLKQTAASEVRLETSEDEPLFEEGSLDAAIMALSEKEIMALSDLQDRFTDGIPIEELLAAAAEEVPGLSEDQARIVIESLAGEGGEQ